jgi:predicted acetyltransferase
MNLKLVFPSKKHELLWHDIVNEFDAAEERIIPSALSHRQQDFDVFLLKTIDYHTRKNTDGYIPATTYFLMEEAEDRIYGAVSIRHRLNEDLLFRGGHIGYGIRPTERRKGFATKMLSLALEECREMNLKKVLVTCDKDNPGSARTIKNNGGKLENEVTEDNGNIVQRYWIELS